ncbi:MAG: MoaD/ThiS family protein [Pseudomonadota bacterium]
MATLTFFGKLADVMGRERSLALPQAVSTAGALKDYLCAQDSVFAEVSAQSALRIAVNDVLADDAVAIRDEDEIAFMPPFSGG